MTDESRRALALLLGTRLRQLRRDQELTQREIAGRVGCSLSYLQALESGSHMGAPTNPTLDLLVDLANLFGVPVADLLQE